MISVVLWDCMGETFFHFCAASQNLPRNQASLSQWKFSRHGRLEGRNVSLLSPFLWLACVANVSARVQPSVRYYSSVFDSVFATVMTVLVLKSVLREICYGAIYSRLQGLGSYGCVWSFAYYRGVLKSRMSVMSICFGHTPKSRKTPSLGHPKQESLRTYI